MRRMFQWSVGIGALVVAATLVASPKRAVAEDDLSCWLYYDGLCYCTWINLCPGGTNCQAPDPCR